MSKYIATRAIRGANALANEADFMLKKALREKGPDTPVSFPNTAYYLPTIYGMTGEAVETLGQLEPIMEHVRQLLHPVPAGSNWTPYLGETLDSGMATLLAAETIQAVRFVYGLQPEPMPGMELAGGTKYGSDGSSLTGRLNGPIDDIQLRSWGIALVDGRMPGFAAIVGAAKSNEVAVKLVRELQKRNILTFLSGNVNGRSIIHQLNEEGVELGYDTYTVPFGTDTLSAIYALGFATRSALTFGGLKAGQARDILMYNRERVYAFVLALGEVDDLKYAAAAGAINFGFPVIADTVIPEILPTGVTTYEHVVSMPFNEIDGADDLERAERLVQKCIEIRGVKIKMHSVPVPVPYGSAFEGEVVRKQDMRVEFGGKNSRCFEYLRMASMEQVVDGKIEIVGPTFDDVPEQGAMDLGIVVEVAGRQMQKDFEPVLERQIHYFINGASGIQHIGQRDIAWIRISKGATDKGFNLTHFGKILHARFHADFGAIVDKVQVTLYTEPNKVVETLDVARQAYTFRNQRLADLTDTAVQEFYSCTLCQSFAPDHVCVISPERLGLCGAYNWLDCKASFSINPTGPNQPIKLGKLLDSQKGYWSGTLDYAQIGSHGKLEEVSMYSIMENPMTACGCFECIVMYVPEVEGVIVVSREDTSMTPVGMKFSTMAGMAGGGVQTPGVMGVGKYYLLSPKFISADGGFKRVVWMSKNLKDSMNAEFRVVSAREGIPDMLDRIADGNNVTTVEELVAWVNEKQHPVLGMGSMVPSSTGPARQKMEEKVEEKVEVKTAEIKPVVEVAAPAAPVPTPVVAAPPPVQEAPVPTPPVPAAQPVVAAAPAPVAAVVPPSPVQPAAVPAAEPVTTDDYLRVAQEAAARQAEALRMAAAEAQRQVEAIEKARAMASMGATPADRAVNMLQKALMAALSELGAGGAAIQLPPVPEMSAAPAAAVQAQPAPTPAPQPAPVEVPAAAAPPPVAVQTPAPAVAQPAKQRPAPSPDAAWLQVGGQTEVVKEKWAGAVRTVQLGATAAEGGTRARVVKVGGETAMPYMSFEGKIPNLPALAVEIRDRRPDDWADPLIKAWGPVVDDPVAWAKAAETSGADLILLRLSLTTADGKPMTPELAVKNVKAVLGATGLPLMVFGPGQAEADNNLLLPVAEATKGERLLLGVCEDKNYRTIVAGALANGHLVSARTAMDVNLAKQLNILISDMGLPLDRVIMDPTTGALGYGFEYGYSVMERLRMAALQGDGMTQLPMLVTPGEECWKTKESKVGEGVPAEWGSWTERGIQWETITSTMLVESGANIVVLRHPESLKRTRQALQDLAAA